MLPRGRTLTDSEWSRRHSAILVILYLHVLAVPVYALTQGNTVAHALFETSPLALAAVFATVSGLSRRIRAGAATLGLLSASAVLVHLSGGLIEMHFHFFVMVPLVALYQDWSPFLIAVGYVLLHHGILGALDPEAVYNHPAAIAAPWRWAAVHALFIAGICAVCLTTWRLNELALERRKSAEGSLRDTLSVLEATLDATEDGILVVTNDGRITEFNQRFLDLWSLPRELVEEGDDERAIEAVLAQLADPEAFLRKVRELYSQPDAVSHDELEFKDGRVFERHSRPHRMGGASVGRVWSFRDITQQKRNEQAVLEAARRDRDAVERLESLDRAKTLLLTAVSHEVRTPLQAISGFAQLLKQRHGHLTSSQQLDYATRLTRNAERLERLILDLFDLDRVSRGIVEARPSPTDMGDLVSHVIGNMDLGDRAVDVHTSPVVVNLDRGMIERIVENLVANAIKHTAPGTAIGVRVWSEDGRAELSVSDRGEGVPEELKEAVFEPFVQGATPAHAPGTGIGLALVDSFVHLHDGRAWVEDDPEGGAVFRVSIPLQAPVASESSGDPAGPEIGSGREQTGPSAERSAQAG